MVRGSEPYRPSLILTHASISYAVPKEVGRVGVESPTFIEPVEKRKDGIEALFSRQAAKGTTSKATWKDEPASPARGKRKRESSPPIDEVEEKPATSLSHGVKTEPVDVDASDSDVEILPGRPPVRVFCSHSHFVSHTLHRMTPPANRKKGKATLFLPITSNFNPGESTISQALVALFSHVRSLTALSFPFSKSPPTTQTTTTAPKRKLKVRFPPAF
jgi:hypothetical protein